MSISAVIWDLGGVLVRTEDHQPRQSLADALQIRRSELEEAVFSGESGDRAQRGELGVDEHWQNVGRLFELDEQGLNEFQQKFWGGDRVDRELVDYIRSLRGSFKTGLLSNAFGDLRAYLTSVWKFDDAFDDLLISSEVGLVKPDPAIYRLALQRLEVEPQQAVFIDDMPANVDGARRVGMHAIRFLSTSQARHELEQLINGAER